MNPNFDNDLEAGLEIVRASLNKPRCIKKWKGFMTVLLGSLRSILLLIIGSR